MEFQLTLWNTYLNYMKLSKEGSISTIGISLIVVITVILYAKYYSNLKTIGEIVVYSSPILFFCLVGNFIINRDRKRIKRAREKDELTKTVELSWMTSLNHDLLTYLIPIIILFMPLLLGHQPGVVNILEAIVAYLALIYLKFIYWGEI